MSNRQSAADRLHRETEAARALLAAYRDVLAEDEELTRTTIEGETDLMEALTACIERLARIKALHVGIGEIERQVTARKQRLAAQELRLRDAMLTAMDLAGLDKIEAPLGTASRRRVPPAAVVTDEGRVPHRFWVEQAPKLDKRALLAALKTEAEPIPGAELSNGGVTVAVKFT